MANTSTDTYSREALKDRIIPFITLSDAENPLTTPVTRRNPIALGTTTRPIVEPSEIAKLRFTVRGNAIVTGGAGMLGLEIARALLEHGASGISLFDLTSSFESAHAIAALASLRLTFPNVKILEIVVDVTSEDAVNQGVKETVRELGSVDMLLCFAGVVGTVHATELTVQHWRRILDINTTGQMIHQNTGGSMVFTASISAHTVNFPQPQVAYNASKGALLQLKSSLAAEWARYGIRVNSISPGYMDTVLNEGEGLASVREIWTSRNPMGRMGDPSELAGVVILLCSPAGKYINGADILVDGGGSVF
ncbi:general substrate transporter [Favolaschia claudopus]|uniref:General substrate transporter n=1 Tax=Favolaschia claudopus TaxID=2862362 RepID=A0AAW0CX95_9AGAR